MLRTLIKSWSVRNNVSVGWACCYWYDFRFFERQLFGINCTSQTPGTFPFGRPVGTLVNNFWFPEVDGSQLLPVPSGVQLPSARGSNSFCIRMNGVKLCKLLRATAAHGGWSGVYVYRFSRPRSRRMDGRTEGRQANGWAGGRKGRTGGRGVLNDSTTIFNDIVCFRTTVQWFSPILPKKLKYRWRFWCFEITGKRK